LSRGRLDVCDAPDGQNPFSIAPRRFWIAARLLAEFALEATPRAITRAREALDACGGRLPEGAPARREIERILAAPDAAAGLAFLREIGLCDAVFPGMDPAGLEIVGELGPEPSLRWAAWLAGTSPQRAMRRLRMPLGRARSIERLLRYHPIERTAHAAGETGVRRLRQRLHPDELEGLIRWRGHQLDRAGDSPEAAADRTELERLREELDALASEQAKHDRIKRLAIGGDRVMEILDRGPGRHVGRALAHLASFIEAAPDANDRARLEAELRAWAERNPDS
jgi:tRNA nucleotidyltransferase/poly(A) polymerase